MTETPLGLGKPRGPDFVDQTLPAPGAPWPPMRPVPPPPVAAPRPPSRSARVLLAAVVAAVLAGGT
ncbi:MAG TPA: hypothetical protein VHJ17_11720, partial [Thermomonospora sp.]|nr:hypothetical protein [Thermomonospora sp.]